MTLSRLAQAVDAMDAGVPLVLEQLAQQLSAVGSLMHAPFLVTLRRGQGVELLTRALQDACQDEPQALEALIEMEALTAARVAYQSSNPSRAPTLALIPTLTLTLTLTPTLSLSLSLSLTLPEL